MRKSNSELFKKYEIKEENMQFIFGGAAGDPVDRPDTELCGDCDCWTDGGSDAVESDCGTETTTTFQGGTSTSVASSNSLNFG